MNPTRSVPQRQDSLTEQMQSVEQAAVEMGCYDAVDWLRANWRPPPKTTTITVTCGLCGGAITQGPQWGDRMVGCPKCSGSSKANPS